MPIKTPAAAAPAGQPRPHQPRAGRSTPDVGSPDRTRSGWGGFDPTLVTEARTDRIGSGRGDATPPRRRELLLEVLRSSPQPRSILSVAEELGVHANTVRFHLNTLLRAGQVEQVLGDATGPGRPPVLFRAAHRMDPDGPTNYRLLASMLTSHLASSSPDPSAAATELGRVWGPHLLAPTTVDPVTTGRTRSGRVQRGEALTRLTRVLSDLGFAPEAPTGPRDTTIRLRHCPFLGLVTGSVTGIDTDTGTGYGDVICSLHLGLMQGALASLHGPVTVDRLDPFVEPDLCVARLAPAATATTSDASVSGSSRTSR